MHGASSGGPTPASTAVSFRRQCAASKSASVTNSLKNELPSSSEASSTAMTRMTTLASRSIQRV